MEDKAKLGTGCLGLFFGVIIFILLSPAILIVTDEASQYLNNLAKNGIINNYSGWQTVEVQNVGSFQVPGDWVVTQYDNVIWLTDKPIDEEGFIIYFTGIVCSQKEVAYNLNIINSTFGVNSTNQFGSLATHPFGNLAFVRFSSSVGYEYENQSRWYLTSFYIDDNIVDLYNITLRYYGSPCVYMIAWDGKVSESIVRRITMSFTRT